MFYGLIYALKYEAILISFLKVRLSEDRCRSLLFQWCLHTGMETDDPEIGGKDSQDGRWGWMTWLTGWMAWMTGWMGPQDEQTGNYWELNKGEFNEKKQNFF